MTDSRFQKDFLNPKSIAVIGAANDPARIGGRPIDYLKRFGYQGQVYPVNPKYKEVMGLPCYPDVRSIPGPVDMAIVALPAAGVLDSIRDCVTKGVKSAIIFSGGFGELGAQGEKMQQDIAEVGRESGITIVGPNCLGVANLRNRVIATFSGGFNTEPSRIVPGTLGLVSQSGALAGILLPMALEMGISFSYWLTTGNEAGVQFADCVSYLAQDPDTTVIGGYLESVRDGDAFLKAARAARASEKPLVIVKCGRSAAGARAAMSHTGALTGEDEIYEAVFKQAGIIRAYDVQELLDALYVFGLGLRLRGKKIAILGMSGGIGALMADICAECGLEVTSFSAKTTDELRRRLPPFGSALNPIDVTAQFWTDPTIITDCLQILLRDNLIDGVLVLTGLAIGSLDIFSDGVSTAVQSTNKPVIVTWMSTGHNEAVTRLRAKGIAAFDDPRRSVGAMGVLAAREDIINTPEAGELSVAFTSSHHKAASIIGSQNDVLRICREWVPDRPSECKVLTEYEAKRLLSMFGLPIPRGEIVRSVEEAVRAADRIGYPVVLKVQSPQILHKTDIGGVKLNLSSREELEMAFDGVVDTCRKSRPEAHIYGLLVEEMLPKGGTETIVGISQDPVFGPVIVFGFGGVFVEIMRDVSRRVAPLTRWDAEKMIRELRASAILNGVRGMPRRDVDALIQILLQISEMALHLRDVVAELDINPLVVWSEGQGAKVADALVVLK